MSNERRIAIGVTGGIAAYKMAEVVSTLVKRGDDVVVAMTDAACRFIGEATMEALSGHAVYRNMWTSHEQHASAHIVLGRGVDAFLIAPCTMDMLAALAVGRADDPVSLLAASIDRQTTPVLVAPSMNATMLAQPATQRHLVTLREDGFQIIEPEAGWQACRTDGPGRLPEPAHLIAALDAAASRAM